MKLLDHLEEWLIALLMVGWFRSYLTPLVVMAAIPFATAMPQIREKRIRPLAGRRTVVLATGDPLNYGVARKLLEIVPFAETTIIPHLSAFSLAAYLSYKDKDAEDAQFVRLLRIAEREARDERNFVKKAVNWAVRNSARPSNRFQWVRHLLQRGHPLPPPLDLCQPSPAHR